MTVVGLHPEELLDKWLEGELTSAERERLQQHLDGCSVCRFEFEARHDFQAEALELSAMAPPPALPLRPAAPPSEAERPLAAVPRRPKRLWLLGICAALISASGVVAAGLAGREPWHPLGRFLEPVVRPSRATHRLERPGIAKPKSQASAPNDAPSSSATPTAPLDGSATQGPFPEEEPRVAPSSAPRTVALATAKPHASGTAEAAPSPPSDAAALEPSGATAPSAAELFAEANQARRARDFQRAAELYQLLQARFPGAVEAELSRVTLALLQLDTGDTQSALSGFERYLAGPSRVLEAEAMVGRARALGRLGLREREVSAWREVRSLYPSSIYGRQATERLTALGQP